MAALAKTIKVLIIDTDKFFIAGLRYVIFDFYFSKDIEVQFITQPVPGFSADIIFQAFNYGVTFNIWRSQPSGAPPPLLFFIREDKNTLQSPLLQSIRKNGSLYRNQPIEVIRTMLNEAIAMQRLHSPSVGVSRSITLRESEVLRYLRQGKSQVETANIMGLHVKTVSTHKRSAMRKLNFKRDHQLYHWLLQGGLSSLES